MKRLWVTGYRLYELSIFSDKDPKLTVIKYTLTNYFKSLLEEGKIDWIISGANLGIEQWALEAAIQLQNEYSIHTALMTPYLEFSKRWNENNQMKYQNLTEQVDFTAATSNYPYMSPAQLKNYQSFMLEHTDRAVLIYDPEHPGKPKYDYEAIQKYQEGHDYPVDIIDFYDLQESAEEYEENHRQENNFY